MGYSPMGESLATGVCMSGNISLVMVFGVFLLSPTVQASIGLELGVAWSGTILGVKLSTTIGLIVRGSKLLPGVDEQGDLSVIMIVFFSVSFSMNLSSIVLGVRTLIVGKSTDNPALEQGVLS